MGLLDGLFATPSDQALWALGSGLLGVRRGNEGRAMYGAMQAYNDAQQERRRNKLTDAQVKSLETTAAQHELSVRQAEQLMKLRADIIARLGGATKPQAPPPIGPMTQETAATPGGQMRLGNLAAAQAGQPASGGYPFTLNDIAAMKVAGLPDLFNEYKFANTPQEHKQGSFYKDPVTGKMTFIPEVKQSQTGESTVLTQNPDGTFRIGVPEGAIAAKRTYNGLAAENQIVSWVDPKTGQKREGTLAQRLEALGGVQSPVLSQSPPDFPRVSPEEQQSRDKLRLGVLRDEQRRGLPVSREIAATQAGLHDFSGGTPAGPTRIQENIWEAGKTSNEQFIKTTLPEVQKAGQAAGDILTSVQVARVGLARSGSGWGKEMQAGAASVLSGLGFAPDAVRAFASGSEVFQQAASTRLWEVLNTAKGPQTEGDADRAKQTFARLANTPEANKFILDLAEATAERAKMKAEFYTKAEPIARQRGDLSEIDREWMTRQPSVFDMPSMKKWKQ